MSFDKIPEIDMQEIILNLWYVYSEDDGFIYSLRAKAYVHSGSDDRKLSFLRERAGMDYQVACVGRIPEEFCTHLYAPESTVKMPVMHTSYLNTCGNSLRIFEQLLKQIESSLPAQTKLCIPAEPIVCITPLRANDDGDIYPMTNNPLDF
jgi:hypothetical protein